MAIVFCGALFSRAETFSLTGTVTEAENGAGIAGVKVGLAVEKNLSTTTDTNGAFTIGGATSIQAQPRQSNPMHFAVRGNAIVFSPPRQTMTGTVDVFSSSGKRIASSPITHPSTGKRSVTLPEFGSGISILRISVNGETSMSTFVNLGKDLFLKNDIPTIRSAGGFTLKRQASTGIVDTLVAEKQGYATAKVGIDGYNKQNVAIRLKTSGSGQFCMREDLQAMVDDYIEAQSAGDPAKMPLAADAKYFQNQKSITAQQCICNIALPIAFHRDFLDVDSCRTFSEVIVTEGGHPYVLAMRLKCDGKKISELNAIVTDKGDWLFNAPKYLTQSSQEEHWDTLPLLQRPERQLLIDASNVYLDYIGDQTVDTVAWGSPCYRIEGGGVYVTPCSDNINGLHVNIPNRAYLIDAAMGTINIFCFFGNAPDSHIIRFEEGKIRYVHTLTACGDVSGACW
jgi:hypothetical protein